MEQNKPRKKVLKVRQLRSSTKSVFDEWWEYSTILENDSNSKKIYKVFIRIAGIITIIIFSPAIAIVMLVALLAVV